MQHAWGNISILTHIHCFTLTYIIIASALKLLLFCVLLFALKKETRRFGKQTMRQLSTVVQMTRMQAICIHACHCMAFDNEQTPYIILSKRTQCKRTFIAKQIWQKATNANSWITTSRFKKYKYRLWRNWKGLSQCLI